MMENAKVISYQVSTCWGKFSRQTTKNLNVCNQSTAFMDAEKILENLRFYALTQEFYTPSEKMKSRINACQRLNLSLT